jgi:hypothetical protein
MKEIRSYPYILSVSDLKKKKRGASTEISVRVLTRRPYNLHLHNAGGRLQQLVKLLGLSLFPLTEYRKVEKESIFDELMAGAISTFSPDGPVPVTHSR